jgi:hypothetical protein
MAADSPPASVPSKSLQELRGGFHRELALHLGRVFVGFEGRV